MMNVEHCVHPVLIITLFSVCLEVSALLTITSTAIYLSTRFVEVSTTLDARMPNALTLGVAPRSLRCLPVGLSFETLNPSRTSRCSSCLTSALLSSAAVKATLMSAVEMGGMVTSGGSGDLRRAGWPSSGTTATQPVWTHLKGSFLGTYLDQSGRRHCMGSRCQSHWS